jgi:2-phosphoglycerate kinase
LAKRLSEQLGISWVSADMLESIVKRYTPSEDQDSRFPKDLMRKRTGNSNDLMYGTYSGKEIFQAYVAQAKTSWQAIETLAESMSKAGRDIIIEGHQLHPELMAKIQSQIIGGTKEIVLTKHDVNQIVDTARESTAGNDWFLHKTENPDVHYKIAEMIARYSNFFSSEAKQHKIRECSYAGDFEEQLGNATILLRR